MLSNTAKRVAVAESIVHRRKSKKFYSLLSHEMKSKNNERHVLSLCCDFILFCIDNIKQNKFTIYLHHKETAKKTPDEVCSFLLDYTNTNASDVIT